ncbi:four helix bundle protein [Nostoc ellipsosporum NOK]|nr:four helix bundle protein [Nostoc ellipsosporum NOK]
MSYSKPYNISERCYCFSKEVVLFIQGVSQEKMFRSLFEQLLRSATSIAANVAEGRAGVSRRDWLNYLAIALKSANETRYWLRLINDTISLNKDALTSLSNEADELSKILAAILVKAKRNNE